MDRGPRTGVTGAVSPSDLHLCEGVGRRARAVVRGSRTLVDGLTETWVGSFTKSNKFQSTCPHILQELVMVLKPALLTLAQ